MYLIPGSRSTVVSMLSNICLCLCLLFCFLFPKFYFSSIFVVQTVHKMFKIWKFSYPILNNTKCRGTRWQIPGQILSQSRVAGNCFHSMWEVWVTTKKKEQYLLGVVNKKQTYFSFKGHTRQKVLRINGRKNRVPTLSFRMEALMPEILLC